MDQWYDRPLDQRAKAGGEVGLNGRLYKGGERMPFYVPRPLMPQIDVNDYPALIRFANAHSVVYREILVGCDALKVHQKVDMRRVTDIKADRALLKKKCLISEDWYVLDGNHRYWAHRQLNEPVPVIQFSLNFSPAIKFLFSFPKAYHYGDGAHRVIQN